MLSVKISQPIINHIKSVVDPELVLNHLGFDVSKRGSKELRGPCRIHGGDNPTGFRFNLDTRTWTCYTRHCEGDNAKDLVGLVMLSTGKNFLESVQLLASLAGVDLGDSSKFSELAARTTYEAAIRKEIRETPRPKQESSDEFSEEYVQSLIENRTSYFMSRGFSKEILDFYEIGGWVDSRGAQRSTIPIRDEDGKLLTISARREDGDEDPKYLLLKDIRKSTTLYNLHVAKHYTGFPNRVLFIVEGFVDVWNLCMRGIYNVVALMGTSILPGQVALIAKYAETAYIVLDSDAAGVKAAPKVAEMLSKAVNTKIITLPLGKDPKDLTDEEIKLYFGGSI